MGHCEKLLSDFYWGGDGARDGAEVGGVFNSLRKQTDFPPVALRRRKIPKQQAENRLFSQARWGSTIIGRSEVF